MDLLRDTVKDINKFVITGYHTEHELARPHDRKDLDNKHGTLGLANTGNLHGFFEIFEIN